MTIKDWSPEMIELFPTTWEEVAAEEVAKDSFFAKVYEDQRTFRDGYDIWKSHVFLPRI